MIKSRIKSPLISRNKKDPTQSAKYLNKTYRNIEERYCKIKSDIKQVFDLYLIGRKTDTSSTFIFREGTIYQANANYIYDMSSGELNSLAKQISKILDDHLLEGGDDRLWILSTIAEEARRGTHSAFANLSHQSNYYAEQTMFTTLLSRPEYQNQIAQSFSLTFNDWKGLTEQAKADLINVLSNAVFRGVNPKETARIISKRLDVSMSKAKNLAQTEQLEIYRIAQWNEARWASDRLGLITGLLHQSALLPTSRISHVYWHGRVRTVEEVENWYSENGNKFGCHCSQIPVLLDENRNIVNPSVIERLTKEKQSWQKEKI